MRCEVHSVSPVPLPQVPTSVWSPLPILRTDHWTHILLRNAVQRRGVGYSAGQSTVHQDWLPSIARQRFLAHQRALLSLTLVGRSSIQYQSVFFHCAAVHWGQLTVFTIQRFSWTRLRSRFHPLLDAPCMEWWTRRACYSMAKCSSSTHPVSTSPPSKSSITSVTLPYIVNYDNSIYS